MEWFKVANRFMKSSNGHYRTLLRSLQSNHPDIETSVYEPRRLENDIIHTTLGGIPAYQNHVLPSPKTCQELRSDSSCICIEKCMLSKRTISENIRSKPKSIINVSEFFDNNDSPYTMHKLNQKLPETSRNRNAPGIFNWQDFEKLLKTKRMDDPRTIRAVYMKLKSTSDMELKEIMIHTSLWHNKQDSSFYSLTKALDMECCERYLNWPVEYQFYMADIWYHLNMGRVCRYNSLMIDNMSLILNNLNNCQLIHLLFIISLRRKANLELMSKIEKILESKIDDFLTEEIVVIAMAYFKTSTQISSSVIISKMINHLNKSFLKMKSSEIVCIVKSLRYSYRHENRHLIEEFLRKAAENYIWKEYFPLAAHLCLLAHRHDIYVPKLLDTVLTDMIELQDVRLKDIAKVLSTLSRFNHINSGTQQRILEFCQHQFGLQKRRDEICVHYQMYISSLLSLSYMSVFIHEELNKAFSNKSAKLDHDFSRDLATLDCIIEVDEQLYTGNRLDANERITILQKYHLFYPTLSTSKTFLEKITIDLQNVLQELFKSKIPLMHLLPYMVDPVFLLIFDESGQQLKPPVDFMDFISKGHIARPTDKNNWVVVWPLSKKEMYSSQDFVGLSLVKERHFKMLGFALVKVPSDVCLNSEKCKRFLQASLKDFKVTYLQ